VTLVARPRQLSRRRSEAELRRKITTDCRKGRRSHEALGLDDLRVVQNHLIASRWIYNEIVSYLDNSSVLTGQTQNFSITLNFKAERSVSPDRFKSLEDKDGQNSCGLLRNR